MNRNSKSTYNEREWGSRFDYSGYHGHSAHCLVLRKGNVIICTEAQDNEGTSITNMAEHVATAICVQFGIQLDKLIWIEHYHHEFHPETNKEGDTFDLVKFDIQPISDRPNPAGPITLYEFAHPRWSHLGEEQALIILNNGEDKNEAR